MDKAVVKVAQSESELLRLAQGIWKAGNLHLLRSLVYRPHRQPEVYSSQALSLLQQTLATGVVVGLARQGSERQRFNRGSTTGADYWWRANAMQRLGFSSRSLQVLRWILESDLAPAGKYEPFAADVAEWGDVLLLYFIAARLLDLECDRVIAESTVFRRNILCWLAYPDCLVRTGPPDAREMAALDFDSLLTSRAWILEALQRPLRRRWLSIEARKSEIDDPARMIALGRAQELLLGRLFDAASKHQRLDLLSFVFHTAGRILENGPSPARWVRSLHRDVSLEQYSEAAAASMAVFRTIDSRAGEMRALQQVRFFDDSYDYSQLVLQHWQNYGERGLETAQRLVNELMSLEYLEGLQTSARV